MTIQNSEYGMEEISIAKARAMLSRLPELLSAESRAVALTRHGKPVMAMMSWDLFESITETMDIMGDPDLMTPSKHRGCARRPFSLPGTGQKRTGLKATFVLT